MFGNSPKPPWLEFPEFKAACHIGWRMGPGEGYLIDLSDWIMSLNPEQRRQYFQLCAPIPELWIEWAAHLCAFPEDDEDSIQKCWDWLAGISGIDFEDA